MRGTILSYERAIALVGSSLISVAVATSALAAETQPTSQPAEIGANEEVGDIVVTAQKRSESLAKVPVSVSVISSGDLATMKIDSPVEIANRVPSMKLVGAFGDLLPAFSIRGIAMSDYSLAHSSPIAVYIDEAYRPGSALLVRQAFDLERIEVLRGPQGSLYGRNATGGAINFVSQKPDSTSGGYLILGVGNYGRIEAKGALQAPLSNSFSTRLAFDVSRIQGYQRNLNPEISDLGGSKNYSFRLTSRFNPSDDFDAFLKISSSNVRDAGLPVMHKSLPSGIGGGLYTLLKGSSPINNSDDYFRPKDRYTAFHNDESDIDARTNDITLTLIYKFSENIELTSITSYADGKFFAGGDIDDSPLAVLYDSFDIRAKQFTQDLRLTTYGMDKIQLSAGLAYARDTYKQDSRFDFYQDMDFNVDGLLDHRDCVSALDGSNVLGVPVYPLGCSTRSHLMQIRRNLSGFLDGSYELASNLKLRAGIRYSDDRLSIRDFRSNTYGSDGVFVANVIPGAGGGPESTVPDFGQRTGKMTGRIGFDYNSGNILIYGNASRGYRIGASNASALYSPAELSLTKPEVLDSLELGSKLQFADRRVLLSMSIFEYAYKNAQAITFNGTTQAQVLSSIKRSRIRGFELDVSGKVAKSLSLRAGVSLADSKIENGTFATPGDINGNRLPNAPRWGASAGADLSLIDNDENSLVFHADGRFISSFYFDLYNQTREKAFAEANARISYEMKDKGITFSLWVKNITNSALSLQKIHSDSLGLEYNAYNAPRNYGAEIAYRF